MKKLVTAATIIAAVAFPAVADAHTLKVRTAYNETLERVSDSCIGTGRCAHYWAGNCQRHTAHRVSCEARWRTVYEFVEGGGYWVYCGVYRKLWILDGRRIIARNPPPRQQRNVSETYCDDEGPHPDEPVQP